MAKSIVLQFQEIIQKLRNFAFSAPFEGTYRASFLLGIADVLEAWVQGRDW